MQYFVTGATGFIGKRLVKALLARRGATVYFLLRPGSEDKVPELLKYWGVGRTRAIPVTGELTAAFFVSEITRRGNARGITVLEVLPGVRMGSFLRDIASAFRQICQFLAPGGCLITLHFDASITLSLDHLQTNLSRVCPRARVLVRR